MQACNTNVGVKSDFQEETASYTCIAPALLNQWVGLSAVFKWTTEIGKKDLGIETCTSNTVYHTVL